MSHLMLRKALHGLTWGQSGRGDAKQISGGAPYWAEHHREADLSRKQRALFNEAN